MSDLNPFAEKLAEDLRETEQHLSATEQKRLLMMRENLTNPDKFSAKEKSLPWFSASLAAAVLLVFTFNYQAVDPLDKSSKNLVNINNLTEESVFSEGLQEMVLIEELGDQTLEADLELYDDVEFYAWLAQNDEYNF